MYHEILLYIFVELKELDEYIRRQSIPDYFDVEDEHLSVELVLDKECQIAPSSETSSEF